MTIVKQGGHRLFERDQETSRIVSEMLADLEKNGMDAARAYSRKFDDWDPPSFEQSASEIAGAIASLDRQAVEDTAFCQANVRSFARAQLATMLPLEVEVRPGVILGHRHIPVNRVGSYIPGGRYPMFGSAQMSIIPAKVAGVKTVVACTPPVKQNAAEHGGRGKGFYPATVNAIKAAGADRIFVIGGVPAVAMMAFGYGITEGIAAGCIQMDGKARPAIWQIFNNHQNVSVPNTFFALRVQQEGDPVVRALQTEAIGPFAPMPSLITCTSTSSPRRKIS